MRITRIGELQVSVLCLGTMYFGTTVDEATAFRLLDAYTEAGGNFLDSANKYASWVPGGIGGESESLVGRWMKQRGNREQLILGTKVGLPMPGVAKGLTAKQIETECEKSLRRLGTDVIDLYYAHADDPETPLEETLAAFDRLVRAGKVRCLGASNFWTWRLHAARALSAARGWSGYVCVQMRHSYLRPNPWLPQEFAAQKVASPEMLDYCATQDVRLLAYSPLLGGAYCRADKSLPASYQGAESSARLEALRTVARDAQATVNQVVLAWLLQSQPAALPLITGSSVEQIHETLRAGSIQLSPQAMGRLNHAGVGSM